MSNAKSEPASNTLGAKDARGQKTMSDPSRLTKTRLVCLSLNDIRPAPENELIYRPVSGDDPEIQKLADSIVKYGRREPIVVTRDGYILSGHLRHAACRLAGLPKVHCRVEPVSRFDPRFETLLREYNRQRVITFDEVVREEVISADPETAYLSLIEHRKAASAVRGEFISIAGTKTRKSMSRAKWPMLRAVQTIINELSDYWPLSDRRIHYNMLNHSPLRHANKPKSKYRNDRKSYQDLCDLLTRARLTEKIPFDAIADPTRKIVTNEFFRNVNEFVSQELDGFLKGYGRNLQQSQPNHIEIVGEKNTIEGSIKDVAERFCIPYTLGRGYCSLDPRYQMYQRFKKSGKEMLIILVLSDFDPEGEDIPHSFARSMRDDFNIKNVVAKKVCLTHAQVQERKLPANFEIKTRGSRVRKFAELYGKAVYELEALEPSELAELLTVAIDEVLDLEAFNRELDAEKLGAARLQGLRKAVGPVLTAALETTPSEGEADA
jgi:hypothetical protein